MFTIAKEQAKLLPSDLAKLLSINRCTVSFWYAGKTSPHAMIRAKVDRLLDAVAAAVQAGDLPVPHDISRRERGLYITQHLVKHLSAPRLAA